MIRDTTQQGSSTSFEEILAQFPQRKILVLGDIMVDEYIWGVVSRISPEAPVPVVEVEDENIRLGGAANVVANIRALRGQADLVGVAGGDSMAERLLHEIEQIGVKLDGIVVDRSRKTTIKTRVVAGSQHVVRFDRESTEDLDDGLGGRIQELVQDRLDHVDALVISDYGKGVINARLLEVVVPLARARGVVTVVDPKINHFDLYRQVSVLTPNHREAMAAWGRPIRGEADVAAAGRHLLDRLKVQAVLVTRGERGMSLYEGNGRVSQIPAVAKEVFDVTGAGDTVVGSMALALASRATMVEAAQVANHAAGVVVGKRGTATVSLAELKRSLGLEEG
ncbi:MAG: D-glycero-beta-D-manno-heptose-7-phosphate kinase [candidate division NC10 bacterium]|nr:D-glycero-beta-D-manno-heptose-7-phosphate kinase [candidate division NC10 bacterium]